jgi:hypothetical protein
MEGIMPQNMSRGAVSKLWLVTDGEWIPMNPTPEWFHQFVHGLLTQKVVEKASGSSVAPRTRYRMGTEEYVVQWSN